MHVYHLSSEGMEQICFLTRDTSTILGASGYLLFSSLQNCRLRKQLCIKRNAQSRLIITTGNQTLPAEEGVWGETVRAGGGVSSLPAPLAPKAQRPQQFVPHLTLAVSCGCVFLSCGCVHSCSSLEPCLPTLSRGSWGSPSEGRLRLGAKPGGSPF